MYFKIEYIKNGRINETVVSAKNIQEAVKKFRQKNLGILKEVYEIKKQSFFEELQEKLELSKIDLEEYIAVLEQIYVMLDAGMGIDIVLSNVLKGIKNKKLKKIFSSVLQDIQAGFSLTNAFEKYEASLGKLTTSMIRLGEETGDLARAVKDLSMILNEILENRKRLKKATRYPMFIIFAMSIAFVIVILFVIPPFKAIFQQLHTQLPLPTRFLLWVEYALQHYGLYVLGGALLIMGMISYMYNTNDKVKLFLDKLILKVYIVGPVIKLAMIGRFTYVLQRLVDAGIPIIDAVDISLNIVDNSYIRTNLEKIKQNIISGNSIYKGFEESGMFESMTVQMVQAGEESGAIVRMLEKVSRYYLDKYRYIVDNIAVMIEPILIAAIAGFVMTLALGIFLPMWNLTQAVQ
jgi:general secretion pathway protein F